jgi:hypothetical protein
MENNRINSRARAEPALHVTIGKKEECWTRLASLIQKRAAAIQQRRADTAEEGMELWKLAESQIEKPLCCGILKLTGGWLFSFNAADLGATDIKVYVEPRRLILCGTNPSIGGTGASEPVVRVLRLPDAVDPASLKIRQEGPIFDIELSAAVPARKKAAAGKAA